MCDISQSFIPNFTSLQLDFMYILWAVIFVSRQSFAFFPLQSVSALLEKFKRSDQVFDINAEVDSDSMDIPEGPADDDFDADLLDRTVAKDLGEFSEKVEACRAIPGSSRYVQG